MLLRPLVKSIRRELKQFCVPGGGGRSGKRAEEGVESVPQSDLAGWGHGREFCPHLPAPSTASGRFGSGREPVWCLAQPPSSNLASKCDAQCRVGTSSLLQQLEPGHEPVMDTGNLWSPRCRCLSLGQRSVAGDAATNRYAERESFQSWTSDLSWGDSFCR